MAHSFLAQLKAVLDNCIDELEQIHFYSRRIRKPIFPESVNLLLRSIYSLCFRCRVDLFQMKSWIFLSFPVRTLKI